MQVAIILILLLVNGIFAMSEIAIVSSRKAKLEAMAAKGRPGAKAALELAEQPTRFLSAIQIGITLIAILAGVLGESQLGDELEARLATIPALAPYSQLLSAGIIVLVITYLSLIIGELVPKRIGLMHAEAIASRVAVPLSFLAKGVAPLVWILGKSSDLVLAILFIKPKQEEEVSEEEIKGLIERGTQSGVIHETEQEIVERVFRLGDLTVKSLMVPRQDIVWIEAASSLDRVAIVVATSPHSHFPVATGSLDKLLGVVHVKDLVKNGLISGGEVNLTELASPPMFVPESTPAYTVLERFRESKMHVAFIVDEFGQLEGLVTLNDIVEAIVGDVARRGDHDEALIIPRSDGSYLVDGRVALIDFERGLDLDKLDTSEFGDVHTLAGLIMAVLGHVPRTGEIARWNGITFEVVDMDRRRIDTVLVTVEKPKP